MDGARAAIAGVLATGIVLLMVFPSDTLREPERAFAALALLLGIVALMVLLITRIPSSSLNFKVRAVSRNITARNCAWSSLSVK